MPAETERKPSDPKADETTHTDQPAVTAPDETADEGRGANRGLFRRKKHKRHSPAPVDTAAQDTAAQDTITDGSVESVPAADDDTVISSATATPDTRRVWRCSRSTTVLVIVLMVVIGIAVPAAAGLSLWLGVTGFGDQQALVLSVLAGLALLTLFFGWRLGLHPRLVADGAELTVYNPFRTHRFDFADITRFAPGGDGLVIGTADTAVDAWCVQKTTGAIRTERNTRADKVSDELWAIRDGYHRPVEATEKPLPAEIRFAHQDDAELLTQLERSASLARLGHIFPPDRYGFPEDDIRERWQSVLADRTRQTMIAEDNGEPVGYVSIGIETVHHMGVGENHQRRGIGSELLAAAEDELFADASVPEIELWVLEDNEVARSFYRAHGWSDSEDVRDAEFPPYPLEVRMVLRNPHLARRGR